MSNKLENFHLKCKEEYNLIIEDFNILFYGYGCKKKILSKIFTNALIFNTKIMNQSEIFNLIKSTVKTKYKIYLPENHKNFIKILDAKLYEKNIKIVLIFLNFDFFRLSVFNGFRNIKIIGTLDNIDIDFDLEDLDEYNFILRDLTTYEPYTEEIIDMKFHTETKRLENAICVYNNVSKRSKNIFKLILEAKKEKNDLNMKDLYEKSTKKYFIKDINIFNSYLVDFFDHEIFKNNENNMLTVNLNNIEIDKMLEHINTLKE
ncbi:putative subunit 2 of origin recognition complex [Hamiltosporidium tvaerminnensis]|uniref:Putative subunit 2 of origin recognition complex n=2 Tax=Hamiltosporidium TaxID=1176354 RepID=A0A4Q9KWT5_9MICR|nr:putative subunit 2 of origin recognition complex [Hamiltosporidium magnivora]TBU08183.1 putative subunit 2 of origin recognition complex [Hamiltosporidium magnivora]TBU19874.1 putative subunit 2 of origin recognition complex [Hamiltosporidium tvaerminnensis]